MKYLCLIYRDERELAALPRHQAEVWMAEHRAFDDDLRKSGRHIAAVVLEPVETATTVRVRGGKVSVTDGSFAETREQLGGFFLIDARDLNEAIQVAAGIPSARLGSVEVRPIANALDLLRDPREAGP
jgi:hypothetical protein